MYGWAKIDYDKYKIHNIYYKYIRITNNESSLLSLGFVTLILA